MTDATPAAAIAAWDALYAGDARERLAGDTHAALEAQLARRGLSGSNSTGEVLRVPLAMLLADSVRAVDAPARIRTLERRGVRAYPLARGGGLVALYAGAYGTAPEAAYLAQILKKAGVPATLVYRIGRSL